MVKVIYFITCNNCALLNDNYCAVKHATMTVRIL